MNILTTMHPPSLKCYYTPLPSSMYPMYIEEKMYIYRIQLDNLLGKHIVSVYTCDCIFYGGACRERGTNKYHKFFASFLIFYFNSIVPEILYEF